MTSSVSACFRIHSAEPLVVKLKESLIRTSRLSPRALCPVLQFHLMTQFCVSGASARIVSPMALTVGVSLCSALWVLLTWRPQLFERLCISPCIVLCWHCVIHVTNIICVYTSPCGCVHHGVCIAFLFPSLLSLVPLAVLLTFQSSSAELLLLSHLPLILMVSTSDVPHY